MSRSQRSHIAGILDSYGGLRVVVAHKHTFKHHLRPDEFLIIVPSTTVREPIAWHEIPWVIRLAELATDKWVSREHNDPEAQWACKLYRLRRLEHTRRTLDLDAVVQT